MTDVARRMKPEEIASELLHHRLGLTAFLRSLVCDRDDAEDLFQDLCVKAVARAADFQNPEHLRRWFFTAGRNAAIDASRRAQRRPLMLSDAALAALAADEEKRPATHWRQRLHALRGCLETLTPRAREIVQLRYVRDLMGARFRATRAARLTRSTSRWPAVTNTSVSASGAGKPSKADGHERPGISRSLRPHPRWPSAR